MTLRDPDYRWSDAGAAAFALAVIAIILLSLWGCASPTSPAPVPPPRRPGVCFGVEPPCVAVRPGGIA